MTTKQPNDSEGERMPRCPQCAAVVEAIAESSGTGVFHPDGAEESEWVEGLWCSRCEILISEGEEAYGSSEAVYRRAMHDSAGPEY